MKLPELHLNDWRPTKDTLHLYCQIVGKVRLASEPPRNHWWNAALYVDVRGLTTRRLHRQGTTFEIDLDFVDHALVVRTQHGRRQSFDLDGGLPVAEFDRRLHPTLEDLGVDVATREEPFGVPMTAPFPQDHEHASWDTSAIERFSRILDWSDSVLEEFSGWFSGKTSPVHLFWHSFDLAVTRFSGRPAPLIEVDAVTQEAYAEELISFGFWAGDDNITDVAYYSYTNPEPEKLRDHELPVGEWGRVRKWFARDPSLRGRAHRTRPTSNAARAPGSVRSGGRQQLAGMPRRSNQGGARRRVSFRSSASARQTTSAALARTMNTYATRSRSSRSGRAVAPFRGARSRRRRPARS
jgi:hypothetical protein